MKIAAYARSEFLVAALEKKHALVFNWIYNTASGRRVLPPNLHQELVATIVGGDPQKAEECMRNHVRYGLESVLQAIKPEIQQSRRMKRRGIPGVRFIAGTKRRVPVTE